MAITPKEKIALLKQFAANAGTNGVDEYLCVPFGTGAKVVQWLKRTVFRKQVELQKAAYLDATPKGKRQIALNIIEFIEASNGIFVEFDKELCDWKQVTDIQRKVLKTMQALRQDAKIFRQNHQKEQIQFYAEVCSHRHIMEIFMKYNGQNQNQRDNLNISFQRPQETPKLLLRQETGQSLHKDPQQQLVHHTQLHQNQNQLQYEEQHQDQIEEAHQLLNKELCQYQGREHHRGQNEETNQLLEPYPFEHQDEEEQEIVGLEDLGNAIWPLSFSDE